MEPDEKDSIASPTSNNNNNNNKKQTIRVEHIQPTAWQPVLLYAFIHETEQQRRGARALNQSEERSVNQYILSDRGWKICELLCQIQWKSVSLPDYNESIVLSKLVGILSAINWENETPSERDRNWDHLESSEEELIENAGLFQSFTFATSSNTNGAQPSSESLESATTTATMSPSIATRFPNNKKKSTTPSSTNASHSRSSGSPTKSMPRRTSLFSRKPKRNRPINKMTTRFFPDGSSRFFTATKTTTINNRYSQAAEHHLHRYRLHQIRSRKWSTSAEDRESDNEIVQRQQKQQQQQKTQRTQQQRHNRYSQKLQLKNVNSKTTSTTGLYQEQQQPYCSSSIRSGVDNNDDKEIVVNSKESADTVVSSVVASQPPIERSSTSMINNFAMGLQEDSDGFPLCWASTAADNDAQYAANSSNQIGGGTNCSNGSAGQKLHLDDQILAMLHGQMKWKTESKTNFAAVFMMLSIIRRGLRHSLSQPVLDLDFLSSLPGLVDPLVRFQPSLYEVLNRAAEQSVRSDRKPVIDTFFASALLRRHWSDTMLCLCSGLGASCVLAVEQEVTEGPGKEKGCLGTSNALPVFLEKAVKHLVDQLRATCNILSDSGIDDIQTEILKSKDWKRVMEFLLNSGHRLAIGLTVFVSTVLGLHGKASFGGQSSLNALPTVCSVLNQYAECEFAESLRDLAIALDLLAQVNYLPSTSSSAESDVFINPSSTTSSSSPSFPPSKSLSAENVHENRLFSLFLSLANLSRSLMHAKNSWYHETVCSHMTKYLPSSSSSSVLPSMTHNHQYHQQQKQFLTPQLHASGRKFPLTASSGTTTATQQDNFLSSSSFNVSDRFVDSSETLLNKNPSSPFRPHPQQAHHSSIVRQQRQRQQHNRDCGLFHFASLHHHSITELSPSASASAACTNPNLKTKRSNRSDDPVPITAAATLSLSLKKSQGQTAAYCGITFLTRLLLDCLKNISGRENKELGYFALQTAGYCCCLQPETLLSSLLADLQPADVANSQNYKLLLKCLRIQLRPKSSSSHIIIGGRHQLSSTISRHQQCHHPPSFSSAAHSSHHHRYYRRQENLSSKSTDSVLLNTYDNNSRRGESDSLYCKFCTSASNNAGQSAVSNNNHDTNNISMDRRTVEDDGKRTIEIDQNSTLPTTTDDHLHSATAYSSIVTPTTANPLQFISVLEDLFGSNDGEKLARLCGLLWEILPSLGADSLDGVVADVLLPCVVRLSHLTVLASTSDVVENTTGNENETGRNHQIDGQHDDKDANLPIINSLLTMITVVLRPSPTLYDPVVKDLLPLSDALFYSPDTQLAFNHLLKKVSIVESVLQQQQQLRVVGNSGSSGIGIGNNNSGGASSSLWDTNPLSSTTPGGAGGGRGSTETLPSRKSSKIYQSNNDQLPIQQSAATTNTFSKFIWDKFISCFKLCEQDLPNLICDSASDYWLVVNQILDLCQYLLAKSSYFKTIFNSLGGPNLCCQLMISSVGLMSSFGSAVTGGDVSQSKAAQRLSSLIGQVLSLALTQPESQSKTHTLKVLSDALLNSFNHPNDQSSTPSESDSSDRDVSPQLLHRIMTQLIDASLGITASKKSTDNDPIQIIRPAMLWQNVSHSGESDEGSIERQRHQQKWTKVIQGHIITDKDSLINEEGCDGGGMDDDDGGYEGDAEIGCNSQQRRRRQQVDSRPRIPSSISSTPQNSSTPIHYNEYSSMEQANQDEDDGNDEYSKDGLGGGQGGNRNEFYHSCHYGTIYHPELVILMVRFTAHVVPLIRDINQRNFVAKSAIHRLNSVLLTSSQRNLTLLNEHGLLQELQTLAPVMAQAYCSRQVLQETFRSIAVLMEAAPDPADFERLIRMIDLETLPKDLIVNVLNELLVLRPPSPSEYFEFPTKPLPRPSTTAAAAPDNNNAATKATSLIGRAARHGYSNTLGRRRRKSRQQRDRSVPTLAHNRIHPNGGISGVEVGERPSGSRGGAVRNGPTASAINQSASGSGIFSSISSFFGGGGQSGGTHSKQNLSNISGGGTGGDHPTKYNEDGRHGGKNERLLSPNKPSYPRRLLRNNSGGNNGRNDSSSMVFPDAAIMLQGDSALPPHLLENGISVAFWIQVQKTQEEMMENGHLWWHIVTVGGKDLSISLYEHTQRRVTALRIMSRRTVIQEKKLKKLLPVGIMASENGGGGGGSPAASETAGRWTHVAVSCKYYQRETIMIDISVNGLNRCSLNLNWNCEEVDRESASLVGFGCFPVAERPPVQIRVSDVLVFRDELNAEGILVLSGLGPNCVSIADTKTRSLQIPGSSLILRAQQALNDEKQMSSLLEDTDGLIEYLQTSLLYVYSPTRPEAYTFYGVVSNDLQAILPTSETSNRLLLVPTRSLKAVNRCSSPLAYPVRETSTLDAAFNNLGGARLLLMLYARIVELEETEDCQAACLRLVFGALSIRPDWWRSFTDMQGGYSLITRLLTSNRAAKGEHLLKAIFSIGMNHCSTITTGGAQNFGNTPPDSSMQTTSPTSTMSSSPLKSPLNTQVSEVHTFVDPKENLDLDQEEFLLEASEYGLVTTNTTTTVTAKDGATGADVMIIEDSLHQSGRGGRLLSDSGITKTPVVFASSELNGGIGHNHSSTPSRQQRQSSATLRIHDALIQDPNTFSYFLTNPKIWSRNWSVWTEGLSMIAGCLQEENELAEFNVMQLNRTRFLKNLLLATLEIWQEAGDAHQPGIPLADHLISIATSLLGSPPVIPLITDIHDFIFLSHPAPSTYLNYRINNHSTWLKSEDLIERPLQILERVGPSPLARHLKLYLDTFGTTKLAEMFSDANGSISIMRSEFERGGVGRPLLSHTHTAADGPSYFGGGRREYADSDAAILDEEGSSGSQFSGAQEGLVENVPVLKATESFPKLPDIVCDIAAVSASPSATRLSSTEDWSFDEGTGGGGNRQSATHHKGSEGGPSSKNNNEQEKERPAATSVAESRELHRAQLLERRRREAAEQEKLARWRKQRRKEEYEWMDATRAGLLRLISRVLLTGPDSVVTRVIGSVVKWEHLLVMLNHQSHLGVREGTVEAMCALLLRTSAAGKLAFLKASGFTLLNNQLQEFPSSPGIVDSLFSLLCGEVLHLKDGLDSAHLACLSVDRFKCAAIQPILGTLQCSLNDLNLFWNLCSNVRKLFESHVVLANAMLDHQLIETLVNVLIRLSELKPASRQQRLRETQKSELGRNHHEGEGREGIERRSGMGRLEEGEIMEMIECWESLATRILQICISQSDLVHHQACVELINLLFMADWTKRGKKSHGIIRSSLCALLRCWFDSIRNLYSDEGLSASNVINTDSLSPKAYEDQRNQFPFPNTTNLIGPGSSRDQNHLKMSHQSAGELNQITDSVALGPPKSSHSRQGGGGGGSVRSSLSSLTSGWAKESLNTTTGTSKSTSSRLSASMTGLKQKILSLSSSGSQLNLLGTSMSGAYNSQTGHNHPKAASQSELLERLKICLQFCADLFLHLPPGNPTACETEEHLFEFFLYFLLTTVKADSSGSKRTRKLSGTKSWQRLVVGCKDKVRLHLAHVSAFVMFPAVEKLADIRTGAYMQDKYGIEFNTVQTWPLRRRLIVARALAHELHYKKMLKDLLDINLDFQFALNIALHELILLEDDETGHTDAEKLIRFLKHMKLNSPFEQLSNKRLQDLKTDEQLCLQTYQDLRQTWLNRLKSSANRIIMRGDNWRKPISSSAMEITCSAVAEQNVPRKLFIQHTKNVLAEQIQADEYWRQLTTDFCHPGACLFDPKSWPQFWSLDPTEGPNRERRRLTPAHINIQPVFLKEEFRPRLSAQNQPIPLGTLWQSSSSSYSSDATSTSTSGKNGKPGKRRLLSAGDGSGRHFEDTVDTLTESNVHRFSSATNLASSTEESNNYNSNNELASQLIDRLRIDEKIAFSSMATIIRSTFECSGEILLGDQRIYFVGESSRTAQKGLPEKDLISMSWSYSEVLEVYKRFHQLLDVALEVFFNDGETYLISFEASEKRDIFLHRLRSMDLPNLTTYSENLLQALTQWWREGIITNFEYLMHLNKLGGRTFSDLMQYPVMPFVLSEYNSLNLDLTSPFVYRDLAKPIAIQDKKLEDHYIKNYRSLELEARHAPSLADGMFSIPNFGAYHYGSHYSNSGIVAHYLVRLPPYTQTALEYQDNNFDIPDRLFHSMEVTWRLASQESTTDFKELIPEFFFMPEFLQNQQGLNLGVRQAGARVENVELPNWVPNNDPRLFILLHRQALESEYVTNHLHKWVDLIFGYKQTGTPAIQSINVFHPATYHGTQQAANAGDKLQRDALKTMVRTYGQMPRQLFRAPHLPHFFRSTTSSSASKPSTPTLSAGRGRMNSAKSPISNVNGVRWGTFVGSPENHSEPTLVLKQRVPSLSPHMRPRSLTILSDLTAVGLPEQCQLIVRNRQITQGMSPRPVKEVESLGVLSWNFPDGIIRGRILSPEPGGPWLSLIALHHQKISCSSFHADGSLLFLGFESGIVQIYVLDFFAMMIRSCSLEKELANHRGGVSALTVCPEYSLFVTSSKTGQLFLWDLNKLQFVRELRRHSGTVTALAVSKTTADVVSVSQVGYGSTIVLETVNGCLVGSIDTDICVCSLALSSLPEGTAVNCLAAGLQNGIIRLWNMWTMEPIRDISHSSFYQPIISLSYSQNCHKLYACTESGTVLCWDSGAHKQSKAPRYVFASPKF